MFSTTSLSSDVDINFRYNGASICCNVLQISGYPSVFKEVKPLICGKGNILAGSVILTASQPATMSLATLSLYTQYL